MVMEATSWMDGGATPCLLPEPRLKSPEPLERDTGADLLAKCKTVSQSVHEGTMTSKWLL
jgi:hypothetical protein